MSGMVVMSLDELKEKLDEIIASRCELSEKIGKISILTDLYLLSIGHSDAMKLIMDARGKALDVEMDEIEARIRAMNMKI